MSLEQVSEQPSELADIILEAPYASNGGAAWTIVLPPELQALTDTDSAPSRSNLRLLEDGRRLGPGHTLHRLIREQGGGKYSFWKSELLFSTSDGSDPNSNGRVYSVHIEHRRPLAAALAFGVAGDPPAGAAVAELAATDGLFPLSGSAGRLFSVFGDTRLADCPVCRSDDIVSLWRMPMTDLEEPLTLFGGYFNQVPTLQVPGQIFCFDFCRGCESIFLNPVPSWRKEAYRHSEQDVRRIQDPAVWQGYEDAYDGFAAWIPRDATVIVDAACGVGQYLRVAAGRGTHAWRRMLGLELGEKYVEHMRAEGLDAHVFDIDNDDLTPLAAPNSVDFITFCEAFEHVERPLEALRKLLVALRPGGRLYFTAQRYGRDVQAAIRPEEPIYIGERVVKELPERLGCRIVDLRTSSMRYYIVLEK
ncbi:MAG: class I SAM-dependent methyltransferase [Thiohalocapsa sp.]